MLGGVQVPGATHGPGGAEERRFFVAFSKEAYGLLSVHRELFSGNEVENDPARRREPRDFIMVMSCLTYKDDDAKSQKHAQ